MRLGPRLLRKAQHPLAPDAEETDLRAALSTCPGILSVQSIRPHHKGGFSAVIELEDGNLDNYIEHMKCHGWINGL